MMLIIINTIADFLSEEVFNPGGLYRNSLTYLPMDLHGDFDTHIKHPPRPSTKIKAVCAAAVTHNDMCVVINSS